MRFFLACLLGATLLPQTGISSEVPYTVVVSSASPLTRVSRRDLAKIFLRKSVRWQDGREAQPVDQSVRSQVRAAFTRDVLKVEGLGQISAVETYWRQEVYSGRNTPPPVKPSDSDVVAYVVSNVGAVGYVSSQAPFEGVKPVAVQD